MYFTRETEPPAPEQAAPLASLLPWGGLMAGPAPTVCQNKDRSLIATLAYQGEDVTMLGHSERLVYLHRLNLLLKRLGTGWSLWADEWHEPSTAYPERRWDNPTACFLDASRRALFTSGVLHESQQYLTLGWSPPRPTKARWFEGIFTTAPTRAMQDDDTAQALDSFVHALTRWSDGLTGLVPAWRWLSPAETLTYYHRGISWQRHTVGLPEVPLFLDSLLSDGEFLPGHTPQLGRVIPGSDPVRLEKYLRPICIKSWPKSDPDTGEGGLGIFLPEALHRLGFPYRYTVRWIALDKADAKAALADYQRKWEQMLWGPVQYVGAILSQKELDASDPTAKVNQAAQDHSKSITRALRSLQTDQVGYGYLTPTVLVWGDTDEELAAREREVVKTLHAHDMIAVGESYNACQAWLAMQPGDTIHNSSRRPPLPSLATAFVVPHATRWAGLPGDAHLKAPALFTTHSDGTPFRGVFHHRDVGNVLLLGPVGSGKTGKMGFMAMQALGYPGARILSWDKDLGLYITTKLAGGVHYHLGGPDTLGLQPFAQVDRSEAERRWAWEWAQQVFIAEQLRPTASENEEIWSAVQRLAGMPPPLRTISTFASVLQVQRLKPALRGFMQGGRYAFFDAAQETFSLDNPWTTFEMRALLELPGALPHALRYQLHRIEALFDGAPIYIFLDEVRDLLADPVLGAEIFDWLKERRKFNVSALLATQELIDLAKTQAWQAVLANCPTKLFLANPAALSTDVRPYYEACRLAAGHIGQIATATPLRDYFYMSPAGNRLYQFQLTPMERLLCAANTQEEIAAFKALEQEERTEPLTAAWLRLHGYGREADIYTTTYAQEAL